MVSWKHCEKAREGGAYIEQERSDDECQTLGIPHFLVVPVHTNQHCKVGYKINDIQAVGLDNHE